MTTFILHLLFQSIQTDLEAHTSAVSWVENRWRAGVCQRFDRLFALCFYGGLVRDCGVVLSGLLYPGSIMFVKEVVLACMCDSASG